MECVPDLAFLQMAAASNSEMFNKMIWQNAAAAAAASPTQSVNSGGMKQRKTNFTSREVEALLKAVADRKSTVLFGVAGGIGWARAWHEVATAVSAVEGIHRSESDVRKKWTYLKWEAKNTSKPGRDPTSRAVLDILTSPGMPCANGAASSSAAANLSASAASAGASVPVPPTGSSSAVKLEFEAAAASNSLLEQLLVPGVRPGSPVAHTGGKKSAGGRTSPPESVQAAQPSAAGQPSTSPQWCGSPEVCLRWNSYHSNMQAVFPALLNNEQFVDVTLACEGRSIKCHKVMLSACSSYLEELLSQNPCQHPIVLMRDLKFWQLRALVEFMYSGEVNVTQDRLPSLLAAADALQIKGLAGPSSSSSSSTSSMGGLVTDDDCTPTVDEVPNPVHKRVRKRKSTNPLPYVHQVPTKHQTSKSVHHPVTVKPSSPVREKTSPSPHPPQNLAKDMNAKSNSTLQNPPSPPPSNHHHPPFTIQYDDKPLALCKAEPLDLGMDSKDQIAHTASHYSTSSIDGDPPDPRSDECDDDTSTTDLEAGTPCKNSNTPSPQHK